MLNFLKITTSELSGNLPSSLYSLTLLTHLWISKASMTGTMSPNIANLHKLQLIDLRNNQFYGTLPTAMHGLTNIGAL